MKKLLILSSVLVAGSLWAQDPIAPVDHSMKAENIPQRREALVTPKLSKPNEIAGRKVTYSGVAVQIVKTKEPWQLINPCAPPEYGSGEYNLDRDIITHKVNGFKLFSINF